jgi:hypothetical protein
MASSAARLGALRGVSRRVLALGIAALLALFAPPAAADDAPFDPSAYIEPDATPVELDLARRALRRASLGVDRFEARYELIRRDTPAGSFRVRYQRPQQLRLDARIDGNAFAYVIDGGSIFLRTDDRLVRAEVADAFGGLERCMTRARELDRLSSTDAERDDAPPAERGGVSFGYRVTFGFDDAGASEGAVWAGVHIMQRLRVFFGVPELLFDAPWHAYHLGETLRFVRVDHDLTVDRQSGIMRRYVLRRAGERLREAHLVTVDLGVERFSEGTFRLQGPVDEQGSRALGLQLVAQALRGALMRLARGWLEVAGLEEAAKDRARVVRSAFAEVLAGAFGAALRREARGLVSQLWTATRGRAGDLRGRRALVRGLTAERIAAMLARAVAVHGADGAAARQALSAAREDLRGQGGGAVAMDAAGFSAALDRARADVVELCLRAEVDPALERMPSGRQ